MRTLMKKIVTTAVLLIVSVAIQTLLDDACRNWSELLGLYPLDSIVTHTEDKHFFHHISISASNMSFHNKIMETLLFQLTDNLIGLPHRRIFSFFRAVKN